MQSRLSQLASRSRLSIDRMNEGVVRDNTKASTRNRRSGSVSGGFATLRNRAGSVLRPKKKGFMEETPAMEGEVGGDEIR